MQVHILTCCRNPEGLAGNLLTFKTLRVGFPTADVIVWDNASTHGLREIKEACIVSNVNEFRSIPERIEPYQWIEARLAEAQEPFVIVDPDVVFWESVEGWDFWDALLAGRLIPKHNLRPDWTSDERLHTSLLFFPHPHALRAEIDRIKSERYCWRPWQDSQVSAGDGRVRYVDVGAALYADLKGKTRAFGEKELDAYDHLFCGTCPDLVRRFAAGPSPWPSVVRRGMWRDQQRLLEGVSAEQAKALDWACGDADAVEVLFLLFAISQQVDDLVDGDSQDPATALANVFISTLSNLRPNPFFQRYEAELCALINSSFLLWCGSNVWAKSDEPETRMFAFVYREVQEQIISWVAYTLGGIDHGRRVALEVHNFYHSRKGPRPRGESFAAWSAEQAEGRKECLTTAAAPEV